MQLGLSPKKQRFVDFIRDFTNEKERPPTFVEIMDGLQFRSLGTVNWYVQELEKEGVICREKGYNGKRALSVFEKQMNNTLPLLGLIAAGHPLEVFENTDQIEVPPSYADSSNYVLRVNGESMKDDGILDGDHIIIRKTETANTGDTIVAYVNDEATLKQYFPKENHIELHPKNPIFKTIKVDYKDDFRIGGIVLAVFRNYGRK